MWERGLKLNCGVIINLDQLVAPHVGAWIETQYPGRRNMPRRVAPHVGAWIETIGRGQHHVSGRVAPHVGAWIETCQYRRAGDYTRSLPMWERGLKPRPRSLPHSPSPVAPHVGAWIETYL